VNFVFIMTDTQNKSMVGAYGHPAVDTPNLDRLAATGIRFERAYTACPLCTPARGAIFSGQHPQINGAWCNNVAPHRHVALLGTIFRHYGFRAAYTGKWHLDGTAYFGNGVPEGGFEPDWWYDGKRYAEDIGPEMFKRYRSCHTAYDLRKAGFSEQNMWGHRVADRAIDFLQGVGQEPFVLVTSFDEPHGPCVAPPEYWEKFTAADVPTRPNFGASTENKPRLQQIQSEEAGAAEWESFAAARHKFFGCNSYIDREIGRVIDAVERTHGDDTVIFYTSDHGDMMGGHGLRSKGPMMYEEICNIPFLVRVPGGPAGVVSEALVSHLDVIPTMLEMAGIERPGCLQGESLAPALEDPTAQVNDAVMVNFHRFAINHDSFGEFYPIRCITDGRYKLSVNLLDTDELYDLAQDPYEMNNLINAPEGEEARNRLHDRLLEEMDRIRDPFRSFRWGDRAWRSVRKPFYFHGAGRSPATRFPFQPEAAT